MRFGVTTSRPFFDTNVLVYLIAFESARAQRSATILAAGGCVSVQVLNEFVSVARRKRSLDWDAVEAWLDLFRSDLTVVPMTSETQARATSIARRHQINIYDATILAAAEQAGCDVVYTEDLQDGQVIGGLTIRNPFADA